MGEADSLHGELLRSISNLYYDFYNNGNCNVIEGQWDYEEVEVECSWCGGSGELDDGEECPDCLGSGYDYETEETFNGILIPSRFQKQIDLLKETLTNKENIILLEKQLKDNSVDWELYENVVNDVIEHIMKTKNKVYDKIN